MSTTKEGLIDKGLEKWQKWNKFTFVLEAGVFVAGLGLAVPWLMALGATGMVVDGVQIYGIDKVKDWRNKPKVSSLRKLKTSWSSQPSRA